MKELTMIDKAFILKKTPLFEGLDLDLLLVISDKLGSIDFDAGDWIFAPGEAATRIYFIVNGEITILDETKNQMGVLLTPDFFGDEALFSDTPRGYYAHSRTDSLLLTLSKTNLFTIISECPQVAMGLLHAYTSPHKFRPRRGDSR